MPTKKVSRRKDNGATPVARKAGATGQYTLDIASNPAKVSRDSVGAKTTRKSGRDVRIAEVKGSFPPPSRSFSKGPTPEQFTAMAGAMYNALEVLRAFEVRCRKYSNDNQGWIQPAHVELIISDAMTAANILRVGLKARFRK